MCLTKIIRWELISCLVFSKMKTCSDQVFHKNTLLLQKPKENCKQLPSPVLKCSSYKIEIQ